MTQRLLTIAPLTLLVLAAIVSVVGQMTWWSDPTSATDWEQGAAAAKEALPEKGAILTHPAWSESPLPYLTEVEEHYLPIDDVFLEDLQGFEDIVLITEAGRLKEAIARLPFKPAFVEVADAGSVHVYKATIPDAYQWGYELADHLGDTTVTMKGKRCTRWDSKRQQWTCPVEPRTITAGPQEVADAPRRCIIATPPKGGSLELSFPHVPLTNTLRVRTGWSLLALRSRRRNPGPIEVSMSIAGEDIWSRVVPASEYVWRGIDIDTSAWAGKDVSVTIEVRASNTKNALLCVNGWVIPT